LQTRHTDNKYANGQVPYKTLKKEIDSDLNVEQISELFLHEKALKVEEIDRNPLKNFNNNPSYKKMTNK